MFDYFAACVQSASNSFSNLGLLDKTLFFIVLISLIAKLALDIVCRHIQKKYNIDPEYKKPCVFLQKGKLHDCSIYKYRKKYFINNGCNKRRCPGYRTKNSSIEEIKQIYKWPFVFYTLIKWVSELSTVILIFRTILKH